MFSNPLPRSSPAPFSLASAGCSSRLTPHYLCKAALVSLPALWLCPMMEFGLVLVCAPLPLTGGMVASPSLHTQDEHRCGLRRALSRCLPREGRSHSEYQARGSWGLHLTFLKPRRSPCLRRLLRPSTRGADPWPMLYLPVGSSPLGNPLLETAAFFALVNSNRFPDSLPSPSLGAGCLLTSSVTSVGI